MKKYIFIFAAALLGLSACSNEEIVPRKSEPTPDGAVQMTVQFPGRTLSDPATRAGTYPAHVNEKSLSNVRIYVFSDKAGQPDKLLSAELVHPISAGDTEAGVTGKFFMTHYGVLHLVAIANLNITKDVVDTMIGMDFAAFGKTLVTQPAGAADAFAMASLPVKAAIPNPNTPGGVVPALSFLLERLSARIDIENLTAAPDEFVLTGARLKSAIDRSFLMNGQTPALTIGNVQYGAMAIVSNDWTTNSGVSGNMKKMYMQLYAYENVANTLIVEVKGTYKGQPAQFVIPFGSKPVKRNFRYVVNVRAITGNKVDFDITVKDWDEGGAIDFTPEISAAKPTIVSIEPSNAQGAAAPTGHTLNVADPNTATGMTLAAHGLYYTKITVESPSTESAIFIRKAEVPWLTVKEIGESSIVGGKLRQTFLVTYGASMDRYPRTAQLEIQNKFSPDKANPRLITVTQPANAASALLLARLSNANVNTLNTFAAAITPANVASAEVMGKLYQWGRNVPFDYTGTPTIVATRAANPDDAVIWSANFIAPAAIPFNWLANVAAGDDWKTLVNKATSAPASYKGSNGGDPSPNGWRLPTGDEYRSMLPPADWANIDFSGNISKLGVAESLKLGAAPAVAYTADYYSRTPNVIYALKLKGAGNTNLTAYRYEYKGASGLWITARHLGAAGAATTVQTVATPAFWASNAAGDVIRYIPAAGYRNNYGSPFARGYYGFCWSSSEYGAENAWRLTFGSGGVSADAGNRSHAFSLRCVRD